MLNTKKRKFTGLVLSVVFMTGVVSSSAAFAKARPWRTFCLSNKRIDTTETNIITENDKGNYRESFTGTYLGRNKVLDAKHNDELTNGKDKPGNGTAFAESRPWRKSYLSGKSVDTPKTDISTGSSNGNNVKKFSGTFSDEKKLLEAKDTGESTENKDKVESKISEIINHNDEASSKIEEKGILKNLHDNKNLWLYGSIGIGIALFASLDAIFLKIKSSHEKTKQEEIVFSGGASTNVDPYKSSKKPVANMMGLKDKESKNSSRSNLRTIFVIISVFLILCLIVTCIFYYFMFVKKPGENKIENLINKKGNNIIKTNIIGREENINENEGYDDNNVNLIKINSEEDLNKLSEKERAIYTIEADAAKSAENSVSELIQKAANNKKIKYGDRIIVTLKKESGFAEFEERMLVTNILSKIKNEILGFWVFEDKVDENGYKFTFLSLTNFSMKLVNELNKKNMEIFGAENYYKKDFFKDLNEIRNEVTFKFFTSIPTALKKTEVNDKILKTLSVAGKILGPYGQIINMTLTRDDNNIVLNAVSNMEKAIVKNDKVPLYLKYRLEAILLYDRVLNESGYRTKKPNGKDNPDAGDICAFLDTLSSFIEGKNYGGFSLGAYQNLLTEIGYYICTNNGVLAKIKLKGNLAANTLVGLFDKSYTINFFGEENNKEKINSTINYIKSLFENVTNNNGVHLFKKQ